MTTLMLEVEVDSEAHPELYDVLAAVGRTDLRCERLRQLASGGLISERLRQQARAPAQAAPGPAASVERERAPAAPPPRAAVAPAPPPVHATPTAASKPSAHALPVLRDVVEVPPAASAPSSAVPDARRSADAAPTGGAAPPAGGARSRLARMRASGLFSND